MRLLLPVLSLFAVSALAQNQIQKFPTPQTTVTVVPQLNFVTGGCPVGFTAQQRGGGQTLWTIALEDTARGKAYSRRPANTGVHVELRSKGLFIRQVELAVSFLAAGGRVVPLADAPSPTPLRKTFTLAADEGSALKLDGDLLVGPAAGITRVHLVSVDYADGSSWHATAGHHCSIEPNRFLLVGAR